MDLPQRARRALLGGAVVSTAALGACVDADLPPWEGQVTMTDGVPVVTNPDRPLVESGEITFERVWLSDDPDFWYQPAYLAIGGVGLVVVDYGERHVVRLDPASGEVVKVIGRPGQGPGELATPTDPVVFDDHIGVLDHPGFERFDLDGRALEPTPVRGELSTLAHADGDAVLARLFRAGSSEWVRIDRAGEESVLTFSPPKVIIETVDEASAPAGAFCDRTITARDGMVVQMRCDTPHFQVGTLDGTVLREVRLDRPPHAYTEEELAEIRQGVLQRMPANGDDPAIAEAMVRRFAWMFTVRFAHRHTFHDPTTGLLLSWEQNPRIEENGPAILHLFSPEGVYLAKLEPGEPWSDMDLLDGHVYALAEDTLTGLVRPAAYRIEVPEALFDRATAVYREASRSAGSPGGAAGGGDQETAQEPAPAGGSLR